MTHTSRCTNAKPESPCKCSCGGKLHAGAQKEKENSFDRILTEDMGGELGDTISSLKGKKFQCTCTEKHKLDSFEGYPHDGGLEDKEGDKWWMYYTCNKCNYQWSHWKLVRRVQIQEGKQ